MFPVFGHQVFGSWTVYWDLKSKHSKFWNIQIFFIRFEMVQYKALVPIILKPDHSKSGSFVWISKWFLTKWQPFVRISNGWAFRFQIPFKIQTMCKPTSFWPFEIQTCPDFRFQLSLFLFCSMTVEEQNQFQETLSISQDDDTKIQACHLPIQWKSE